MIRKSISFRAHQDDSVELRTEQYLGRDHLVVPVVALVEGVLQGMNAATPELALAEEFGRVPEGWDGRPLVMNHPVVNGIPVSANSPSVLESYSFGYLFNTKLEDAKLKTEAWIDLARVEELGGEVETTVQRIRDGEVVEVSTGLFTATEPVEGKFNGRNYKGVWRGVVPDHLAFLSEGVLGACSAEDGCGTPRVNSTSWQEYKMSNTNPKTSSCGCGCNGTGECNDPVDPTELAANADPESVLSRLIANAVPDSMLDADIRKILSAELNARFDDYIYLIGFNATNVIFERYGRNAYRTWQLTYDIDDNGAVNFGGEPEEVTLMIRVIPVTKTSLADNQENDEMDDPKVQATTETTETTVTPETQDAAPAPTPAAPAVQAAPKAPAQPRTLNEYLAEMPEEMRESISAGIKLHTQQKNTLVASLRDSGRCKFSEEQLKAMSLEMLENLAELAAIPAFTGVATPRNNASESDAIPVAPVAFPRTAA